MGFINWDVTGFFMPLLVKENIVHIHPNNFPTVIYLREIKGENTSTRCEIYSEFKVKDNEPQYKHCGITPHF